MKTLLLLIGCLSSIAAQADLSTQMNRIKGDWRLSNQAVLRIQQQSDRSIKLYWCDVNTYFNNNRYCSYSFIKLYEYRADLDAFYAPTVPNTYCAESLQVSLQSPNELIRLINPYGLRDGCGDTGEVHEAKKL